MRRRILAYVWASGPTGLGLLLMPAAVLPGGSARVVDGVLEVHGGLVTRLLKRGLLWVGPVAALVLGHVILGCDRMCLDRSRRHEHVHAGQ